MQYSQGRHHGTCLTVRDDSMEHALVMEHALIRDFSVESVGTSQGHLLVPAACKGAWFGLGLGRGLGRFLRRHHPAKLK